MDPHTRQTGRVSIVQATTTRRDLFKIVLALVAASYGHAFVSERLDSEGWILGPRDR